MSAPPGPPGGPVNGAGKPPSVFFRPKPKASVNPLVARKRPVTRPAISKVRKVEDPSAKLKREQAALRMSFQPSLDRLHMQKEANNGWSEKAPPGCQEFPLVTSKRALLEGIRYHIMRLNKARGNQEKGEGWLDVTDQDQFPRPVTLHRRDPRQLPAHKLAMLKDEDFNSGNPADEAEADRIRQQKIDREAQRALDQAQIAPAASKNSEPKQKQNKKEKVSTFYARDTDQQKKQSGLRYEETLPWHLEDAEGKAGVWVGSYIAGLSDLNCALVIDGNRFRMIPLERFYRFDEKPKFNTFTLDDAETMMKAKKVVKRWVMHDMEKSAMDKEREETKTFLRGRPRVKMESATSRAAPKGERQDDYELDMSGDEFQDDDETPGFEADDEDAKDAKTRIRREALGANLFGEGEESKVDEEEREQQLEKLKRKMIGKKTMKDLMKLEHAMDYDDSDSENDDNNPFTDSSVSVLAIHSCLLLVLTWSRNRNPRLMRRRKKRRRTRNRRSWPTEKSKAARAQQPRARIHLRESQRPSQARRRVPSSDLGRQICQSRAATSRLARRSRSPNPTRLSPAVLALRYPDGPRVLVVRPATAKLRRARRPMAA